ncbi:MAG: transporter substrate-binding domain-containing protein [Saccharospirillum sp.]|uniref:substrate-binding periplasmic protein n=1 Tax=Saccharospirillum sp. TaxID=2033801 RepID=UPI003296AEC4
MNQVGMPLFTEVYEQLGQAVTFVEIPTARESRMIAAGNIDAVSAQIDGHQLRNPDLIQVPVPLTQIYITAFVKGEPTTREALLSRETVRLGRLRSLTFGLTWPENVQWVEVNQTRQLIQLLNQGRIDAAISPELSAQYFVVEMGLSDIHRLKTPLASINVYHYIHRDNQHLLPDLTRILLQMEQDGSLLARHNAYRQQLGLPAR